MKILNRHIGLTVISSTLLVLLVLLGLEIFISLVAQFDDIGKGNYGIWQALQYVPLTLPTSIYNFFPMAGLLGCLLGLGTLANHSELIVMRASGTSLIKITWAVLRAMVLLIIVMTLIGELIGPHASQLASTQKEIAKSGEQILHTQHGMWMRNGNTFIHIQNVIPGIALKNIYQYKFNNNHQLLTSSFAQKAVHKHDHWLLRNIVETHFDKHLTRTQTIRQKIWPIKINTELLNISDIDSKDMSLNKLLTFIHIQRINGLDVQHDKLVFWQRALQPLATIVMIFLAIPFIFGPLRTVPMGVRILTGIVVGFSFYLLNQFLGPLSLVYRISPFIGAIFPSILFLALAFFLLRKVR